MGQNELPLAEQIDRDLQQAMRDKDDTAKIALRSVKTALTEAAKASEDHTQSEDDVLAVIQKQAKQRRDAAAEFERVGAADRAASERAELAVLERYLPRQLSEDEIESIVREVIAETGASSMQDMGRVMSTTMPKVQGKADGKVVNQVVRRLLSQ
jgi:uncharacterized protein